MLQYKISYLTDGTKVKITNQLFNQIKLWETEGISIESTFLDELKIQDNNWINSSRSYYRNTIAIESLSIQFVNQEKTLRIKGFQEKSDNRILLESILVKLSKCTKTQRRRFLLYHYYGLGYTEIAQIEGKNECSIRESIEQALKILTNNE